MASTGAVNLMPLSVRSAHSSNRPGLLVSGGGVVSTGNCFIRPTDNVSTNNIQRFPSLLVKATDDKKTVKVRSLVCAKCEGNGAVACSQCKGSGINSEDHFNGRFKAGGTCWLCRSKKEMLCGDCNGAGFVGGFMSTHDE